MTRVSKQSNLLYYAWYFTAPSLTKAWLIPLLNAYILHFYWWRTESQRRDTNWLTPYQSKSLEMKPANQPQQQQKNPPTICSSQVSPTFISFMPCLDEK